MANRYIVVRTENYTDWYTEDGEGGGGWRKFKTTYHGYTEQVIWIQSDYYAYEFLDRSGEVNRSGGGGKGPYGNTYTGIVSREEATIKKIEDRHGIEIINELTGKEKCLNKLLTEGGTNFVKNLLKNFEGESEFDIKIQSKDKVMSKGKEVNGTTTKPVNKIITIDISSSKINQHAALDGARTILHEYIHADIFRKLNTKYTDDLDFKKTYDAYGTQHEAMGTLYVDKMRDALKHFHKNVLTEDYNKYVDNYEEIPNDDFYEALAWRGLKEHNVKAWTDLSIERKDEINNLSIRVDVLTKAVNCSN